MAKDIKDYILNKLFFPKLVVIDKPGVIINQLGRKYGNIRSRQRTVIHFEDIIVNLQLETAKEIGREKAEELWYKIGKDVGVRYMLLSKAKKPPSFLIPTILDHIFKGAVGGGSSFAEEVEFDGKEKSLTLKGKGNPICRKTNVCVITGSVSSIFSFLVGENIEAKTRHDDCSKNCLIVADKNIKGNYSPEVNELKPLENYEKINFPENSKINKGLKSYRDLIRFKKINLKFGKHYFYDRLILPSEIGCLELIAHHYINSNKKQILKKGLIEGAQRIAKEIIKESQKITEKLDFIKNILSSFGWGIPHFKTKSNEVICTFNYPPFSKYENLYLSFVLNGFLNHIFDKKFKLEKMESNKHLKFIEIKYV